MVPTLKITDLRKSYGAFKAVDGISLNVKKGEFLTLLGPSGCGKTTTLRLIGGIEKATAGTIEINGKNVNWLPSYKRATATVFQSGALFPHMTVSENVSYGLRMHGVARAEIGPRVERILQVVRMSGFANRYPSDMSGGQRQRIALARAMVIEPSLLLFDEPMSALDLKLKLELRAEIRRLHREIGFTAIFVTHDQSEAMSLSDRIAILNKGRVAQVGSPIEIFQQPASEFVYGFIGESCHLVVNPQIAAGDFLRLSTLPGNAAYRLYLRPTHLKVAEKIVCDNYVRGIVETTEYIGGAHRIHVDTPAGKLFVDLYETPRFTPGNPITIGWSSADATYYAVQ
ncbi:ABC transporter ATP-binding protein [Mesorhizobium sp.]|uniref:ABC transporter ATP-binding protein n=1 Tax=Mesorhizobium sp. TaxID=1871066 RepID=UPI000FE8FC70|nr:ABC transporter ATP-binding protein [Mesorhizobium sp.]RWB69986.1 MAG: ABC transporter ATP-binding protein [Mesorhizobium sp.]